MAGKIVRPRPVHRPVSRRQRWRWADFQGRLPVGWCEGCGAEVFDWGRLCLRCVKEEEG